LFGGWRYARLALYRGNYNIQMYIGHQKIVAISEFGVIKRGDKMREHLPPCNGAGLLQERSIF
jgi:hypothetical protein